MEAVIGKWAFIIGVIIAALAGIVPDLIDIGIIGLILVILGLVVGFLNISDKESGDFLIAAIALLVVGAAGLVAIPAIGEKYLVPILTNIVAFVAPATLVVSLKAVYVLAKTP